MHFPQPIIVKLGGSVITVKEKLCTSKGKTIVRLAKEIARANVQSLIVVHGGGSFGHPLAKQFALPGGYRDSKQLVGFSQTHQAMVTLNKLVVDALIHEGIPAIPVQPSAFILTSNGRIVNFDGALIVRMLELNFVPVLYGDTVLDDSQGFSILSGDQIVTTLATRFSSQKVILCVDVDGLFTDDPKRNPQARLLPTISCRELHVFQAQIHPSSVVDVTGGMHGKLVELLSALDRGVAVALINGNVTNRLYKALSNQQVKGTRIEP